MVEWEITVVWLGCAILAESSHHDQIQYQLKVAVWKGCTQSGDFEFPHIRAAWGLVILIQASRPSMQEVVFQQSELYTGWQTSHLVKACLQQGPSLEVRIYIFLSLIFPCPILIPTDIYLKLFCERLPRSLGSKLWNFFLNFKPISILTSKFQLWKRLQ